MSNFDSAEIVGRWGELVGRTRLVSVRFFGQIDSTNTQAREILRGEDSQTAETFPLPGLIVAGHQTAGRGRGDHRWWSPEGGLYLSLVARWSDFGLTRAETVEFSLRIAHGVAKTVAEDLACAGVNVEPLHVKPPNDLYFGPRKMAGILIESPDSERVIVGIGVNLNTRTADAPPELHPPPISLLELIERRSDEVEWVARLIKYLLP